MLATSARRQRRRIAALLTPGLAWITLAYVVPGALIVVYSLLTPKLGGGVIWELTGDAWNEITSKGRRSDASWGTLGAATFRGVAAAAMRLSRWRRVLGICGEVPAARSSSLARSACWWASTTLPVPTTTTPPCLPGRSSGRCGPRCCASGWRCRWPCHQLPPQPDRQERPAGGGDDPVLDVDAGADLRDPLHPVEHRSAEQCSRESRARPPGLLEHPLRGAAGAGLHGTALHGPAPVRSRRTLRPCPTGSGPRPRGQTPTGLPGRVRAAHPSGIVGRLDHGLRPVRRPVPGTHPAWAEERRT